MNELCDFLEKCSNDIRQGTATEELISSAVYFYIRNNVKPQDENIEQENIMKYYTLGWYIYQSIENNKN
jgi:hypothetical protein